VVITEEAAVRYGPLEEAQTAFQLPEGAEVRILDGKGEWVQVRDGLGRTGWLMRNRLETWR
jgi:SH3-like domain-containing protein